MNGAVVVSGATGLVGRALIASLVADGVPVCALTRRLNRSRTRIPPGAKAHGWNGRDIPADLLRGARAVVHLAGEPLFGGLPTPARLRQIRSSRIDSTLSVGRQIAALPDADRPEVFVCASAVGLFGDRGDEELGDDAAPGRGFLADLCRAWETAARAAKPARIVSLRFGIVLSRAGGALPLMARPFQLGLGGRLGSGRQWVPWIHLDDAVGLTRAAITDPRISGALNAVAPKPLRNAELTIALGQVLGRPTLLPVPAFALRLALRDLSGELLGSKRVLPRAALAAGYRFEHAEIGSALERELR
jgi:uncharacterized protein (TIGR01777 family)